MTHPDLARLRALAEAAKQDCRIGEESCPACCAKRELTGDVVLALLAEVEAGRLEAQLSAEAYLAIVQERAPELLTVAKGTERQRPPKAPAKTPTSAGS